MKRFLMLIICTLVCSILLAPSSSHAVRQKEIHHTLPQFFDVTVDVNSVVGDIVTAAKRREKECQATLVPDQTFVVTGSSGNGSRSRYVIGVNIPSRNLFFTLNVDVNSMSRHLSTGTGSYRNHIDSKSSVWSKTCQGVSTIVEYITWPFKWIATKMAKAYGFTTDLVKHAYYSARRKYDNPIEMIEMILELIYIPVGPALRGGWYLCETMAKMKREIRNKTLEFIDDHPVVLEFLNYCQIAKYHVSALVARWPWNWMDSILYVGFSWVICYLSYYMVKFAKMDDHQLQREARRNTYSQKPQKVAEPSRRKPETSQRQKPRKRRRR